MTGEPQNILQAAESAIFGQTVHVAPGEKVYAYNAIFAPANLKTTIVHDWQFYDAARKTWVSESKLSFSINGGRKEGYKGYSWQSNLMPGSWRVYVKNQRGQVLGIVRFTVVAVSTPVTLEKVTR